jgi:branched-chain amino acid transport system permease protein
MTFFVSLAVTGLATGAIYALIATGLVVTYNTTGVFNFAHGAIGMAGAFVYWQLWQGWHLNPVLAMAIVLVVVAPAFGLVIERVLMRGLAGAAVDLSLVVTLGLMLFLVGGANVVFNPTVTRNLPQFLNGSGFHVGAVVVSYDRLIAFLCLIGIAVGLYLLFSRTRVGIAMRAVVDSPELVAMAGGRPVRIQQLAWALGCSLAALAGILIAQLQLLNILSLTLLVLDGYAAAIIGRLRSLPIAIGGALAIGLANSLQSGYIPSLSNVDSVVPLLVLFVALLVLPQDRLRTASLGGAIAPRVASLRSSLAGAGALAVAAVVLSRVLSSTNLLFATEGLAVGLLLLSLVLLTGYGGMVSLCQMTIAGLGAVIMSNVAGGDSLLGIIAAVAGCAVLGALLALPTLRLRGLYLALATFSFAAVMDNIGFSKIFGLGGAATVGRPHIPGIPTQSPAAFFVVCAVVFGLVAVALLALRRSSFGRRLVAINDSPAACATLGISVNRTKLVTFTISAGIAGLAGALYAAAPGQVSANDFASLVSLVVLLLARVGGINTATGALVGGILFIIFPIVEPHLPAEFAQLQYMLTGLAAVSVGRDPNGFGGRVSELVDLLPFGRRSTPAALTLPAVAGASGTPAAAFLNAGEDLVHAGR